jgi:hypothetical protein
MRYLMLSAIFSIAAMGAEYGALETAARKCIEKHSTAKETESWWKAWQLRSSDRDPEAESEEQFTVRVVRAWFIDRRGMFETPEKIDKATALSACRWFCLLQDKGYPVPAQISDRLTPEVVQQIIAALEKI